ncbi:prolipoprotein diacylglyceryl transferase [Methylobacterium nodulans]|uniref:Phosphatidylglycerol--prolipoprotein diacylglyceryl transferase n=1 Tax=Methylobacterium nodulans (strain LMG 21967 / CNCM I-2342 / ORS 2060) TaxID=460265 RepID=B8IG30_METNO|nr:prolipoprotein diacylglyceryl transferase [Methylobacterium nodulans]ACL61507.1 prolipoprotein diacylglyceryl transferase [Methylobacterium nodulans ORS 2060]
MGEPDCISGPLLHFPTIDPVLVQIGPVSIRWYALAYIAGLAGAWWRARWMIADARLWRERPCTPAQRDDLLVWTAIGVVAGGRLGQVLLYEPGYYLAHVWEIPQVWRGGMSFHGGLTGAALALILFCRCNRLPILPTLDLASATAPIGLFLGRLANFVNGELWGRTTDVPWGIVFPTGGDLPRHPSQLYEAALEGAALFIVLDVLVRAGALRRPGLVAGAFGYAGARSFCELYREPDGVAFGGLLTLGQSYSLPMAMIGVGLIVAALRRGPGAIRPASAPCS